LSTDPRYDSQEAFRSARLSVDPGTSHLEQLEAAQRRLLVYAGEINHLYQAERARAAELERALERLRGSYLDMIKALAFVVEAKDPSTRAHLQRTHDYAVALAEAVDPELAADEQLRYGFLLHDVGKVGIPEAVLNKPGPLDAREWEVMRGPPAARGPDGGRHQVAGQRRRGDPLPPRALGRQGLPVRPGRRGHPSRSAGVLGRRRFRRHRPRPPRLPAREVPPRPVPARRAPARRAPARRGSVDSLARAIP
jgi:hypothetical protein